MANHFTVSLLLLLTMSLTGLASNFNFSYDKIIPIFGGRNPNSDYLQSGSTTLDQFRFVHYSGDNEGLFYGLNYSNEKANYTQNETSSRISSNFNSTFISIGPEVGIWAKALDSFKVESAFSVGFGNFKFKDSNLSEISNIDSKKIDLHFGLSCPLIKFNDEQSFNLQAKMGYYRIFLNEFTYNSIIYSSSELNFKQFLYFSIGINFDF